MKNHFLVKLLVYLLSTDGDFSTYAYILIILKHRFNLNGLYCLSTMGTAHKAKPILTKTNTWKHRSGKKSIEFLVCNNETIYTTIHNSQHTSHTKRSEAKLRRLSFRWKRNDTSSSSSYYEYL